MDYKFLFLLTLLITLVLVLVKFKKELFFNEPSKVFCDEDENENNFKLVMYKNIVNKIDGKPDISNAYGIACNVRKGVSETGGYIFDEEKKSHILIDLAESISNEKTITLRISFMGVSDGEKEYPGIGPLLTGENWSLFATPTEIIFKVENLEPIKFNYNYRNSSSVEISYDKYSAKVSLRLNINSNNIKEIELGNIVPNFGKFYIGKGVNPANENEEAFFNGYIYNMSAQNKLLYIDGRNDDVDDDETSNNDDDKLFNDLLNLLLNLTIDEFTNYNNNEIEHFQGNDNEETLVRPQNFKTVKLMDSGDNELEYIKRKVDETKDDFEISQENNKSQEIQLTNVIIHLGSKFIKSAINSKYGYKKYLADDQIQKTKCFEDDTVRACVFFNDKNPISAFKFINNPIDGAISIKSKLNNYIDSVLSHDLVKEFFNKMEDISEKLRLLTKIKDTVNNFLKDLRKPDRSDAFSIYFELDLEMLDSNRDFNFKLKQFDYNAPNVYLSPQDSGGEMSSYNDVGNCNFNPYGNKETECLRTCFENADKINCSFESCYNVCSKCEDPDLCKWLLDSEQNFINQACNFDANVDNIKDTTEVDCVKLCQRNENVNCSENVCKNLCSRCSNEETCSWIKTDREFAADIQNVDYPSPPIVSGIAGDKQITLSWNVNDNGGAPIEKFIFMAYKTNNHKEGMRVEVAHNDLDQVSGRYYEHSITGLENNKNYTISIAAVNKRGLSAMSKPVVIKPYKYSNNSNTGEGESFPNTNTIQIDKRDEIIESIVEKLRTGDLNNINEEMKEITEINESMEKSKSNGMDLFSQLRKIGNIKLVSS